MATQASGVNHWVTLNGKPLIFQAGAQNTEANAEERKRNVFRLTSQAPKQLEIFVDEERLETEIPGFWYWFPKGYAGLYKIRIALPNGGTRSTGVRVVPSQISYARYKAILQDINRISVDLLFQLHSPAREHLQAEATHGKSAALREFALIESVYGELRDTIAQIRRNPQSRLREGKTERMVFEPGLYFSSAIPIPGPAVNVPTKGRDVLPRTVPLYWTDRSGIPSYDVYENRLLKHFLWQQLLPRIESIRRRALRELQRRRKDREMKVARGWEDDESVPIAELEKVIERCRQMQNETIRWGSEEFLRSVGSLGLANRPTQILQKHPHYSRFYAIYLRFQQELRFSFDPDRYPTSIAMRKLSELYEIWAVFTVTQILLGWLQQSGYTIASSNGFFTLEDEQFQFEVDRNAAIELSNGDKTVKIRYEPIYPPAQSVHAGIVADTAYQLSPDLCVELWEGGRATKLIVFDAKYRSEAEAGKQTFLREDVEKMDHYFQRLRWKTGDPRQRPRAIVSSAYIIYPGEVLEQDAENLETGALPLIPAIGNPQVTLQSLLQIVKKTGII